MLLVRFLILLIFLNCPSTSADPFIITYRDGKEFLSRNGKSRALLANNGKEIQVVMENGSKYNISVNMLPGWTDQLCFADGTTFILDDGISLIWMLLPKFHAQFMTYDSLMDGSPLSGSVDLKKGHSINPFANPRFNGSLLTQPALALFRNGKLTHSYNLAQLLVRPQLVMESSSHTRWLEEDIKHENSKLSEGESHFSFNTTSFRNYSMDTKTGDLQKSEDSKIWKSFETVVWGHFIPQAGSKRRIRIEQFKILKGKVIANKKSLSVYDPSENYGNVWTGAALKSVNGEYVIDERSKDCFPVHSNPW